MRIPQTPPKIGTTSEPENNLHPQLLRRLLNYIQLQCETNKFNVFFTTHSNVTIDFFSTNNDAQIYHIRNEGESSSAKLVETFFDNKNVLTDLDIRASDLLQSNGVIWVEGPSDRVLLKEWINIWSNYELKEGTHYQIMFYGGRLLNHLSATPSENELISMLKINTNAAIVIDSDKKSQQSRINDTKKRIKEEFESFDGFVWITKGKEIENYYPPHLIENVIDKKIPDGFDQFTSIFSQISEVDESLGTKLLRDKVGLASKIIDNLDIEEWKIVLDLDIKLSTLVNTIKNWNSV